MQRATMPRMTTTMTTTTVTKQAGTVGLLEHLRELAPVRVGALLVELQRTHGVDREVAASAMWDAVEAGHVTYGTDGWVRAVTN